SARRGARCDPRATHGNGARPQARPFRSRYRCPHQQPAKEAGPRPLRRADQSGARQRIRVCCSVRDAMTIKIQILFVKIFLWFWATAIATGIALVVTWILLQPKHAPSQSENNLADTAWVSGTSAVDALERQGPADESGYMGQPGQKTHLKRCLFDASGSALAGNNCPSFDDM